MTRKVRRYSGGVYDLGLHVVWCPKYRRPVLGGRVAVRLRELIEQKAAEKGWEIVALEVMPDHVHLFVKHEPKASASYVANQFKGFTSRVLREEFPHLRSRMPTLWSSSFFAASCGRGVSADTVQRYIDTQWERPWGKKKSKRRGSVRRAYKFLLRPTVQQAQALSRDAGRSLLALQRRVAGTPGRLPAPVEDHRPLRRPVRPAQGHPGVRPATPGPLVVLQPAGHAAPPGQGVRRVLPPGHRRPERPATPGSAG